MCIDNQGGAYHVCPIPQTSTLIRVPSTAAIMQDQEALHLMRQVIPTVMDVRETHFAMED